MRRKRGTGGVRDNDRGISDLRCVCKVVEHAQSQWLKGQTFVECQKQLRRPKQTPVG